MNPLQRALIEKAGHNHGFEYIVPDDRDAVHLASARHRAHVHVTLGPKGGFVLTFTAPATALLHSELARSFPTAISPSGEVVAGDQGSLARLLRRAAELAHSLPDQAVRDFDAGLKDELAHLPDQLRGTEIERMVRQRVGQHAFRSAMLDYWGGACAVTGLAIPELLRASHARPWAECTSDAERLDVFNGFLLSPNLDALFDRFMISFSDTGGLLVSPALSGHDTTLLGLKGPLSLRWLADGHMPYLQYHREVFSKNR